MGFNNSFLSSFSVMLLPVIWIRECIISSLCISFNKKEVVTSFWTPAFSTFFFPHMSSLECREEKKKENTMDNALKTNFQALRKMMHQFPRLYHFGDFWTLGTFRGSGNCMLSIHRHFLFYTILQEKVWGNQVIYTYKARKVTEAKLTEENNIYQLSTY